MDHKPDISPARILYHFPLSPASRAVRLTLQEKQLPFDLQIEKPWDRKTQFLKLSPSGDVPVLIEEGGFSINDAMAACEYLNEKHKEPNLLGDSADTRAEVRRLCSWFFTKFTIEVSNYLIGEKIYKRFARLGSPQSEFIRAGKTNLGYHLDYISYLNTQRHYLASDLLSLADLVAAAHISVIDYLGDINWADYPEAQDWYAKVKSRPSFKPLLQDFVPGLNPAPHYALLDF